MDPILFQIVIWVAGFAALGSFVGVATYHAIGACVDAAVRWFKG